jgi:DNA polymerase-3 subunit alpha
LRKAISKKKKEDIDKHRAKFVKGAVEKGMDQSIADAIYMDWEEFARYGFNKSHAADYGVIAVQTAYLKSTYPAEYMAALLSASAGQTDKIAFYVADSRNMDVPVLAPDVNASNWDFGIEDVDEKPSIRFGLGAIKNVSQGAVEIIEGARAKGKFTDLNDFARRVDLRGVGKRSLECLIKVGALDQFGNRASMLASLDRIVAISANHFRAADAGQMSLFGAATGIVEEIHLPEVKNVDKREMLNWERELIGLYITDHPLNEHQAVLAQIVSYFSGQLSEAVHEEKVRVAGLITVVRPYTTKTGKAMGFVTIEDIQGTIELVMFPKTWTKFMDKMVVGQIIIVKGKVDNANPPAKILVDEIDTEIKVTSVVVDEVADNAPPTPLHYKSKVDSAQKANQTPKPNESAKQRVNVPQIAEVAPVYIPDTDLDGMPPPPDNFPDGWDIEWQPSFEEAAIASKPEPKFKKNEPVTPPLITRAVTALANIKTPEPREERIEVAVQSMYVPLVKENKDKEHPPRQLTITLRSTGDHERDKRRIKTLHGLLTAQHGRDKFSFQIFENSKGYLIDFPNDTTRICPALLEQLKKLIGEESWRVEEITFQ